MDASAEVSFDARLAAAGQRFAEARAGYRQLLGQQREEQRRDDPLLAIGRKRHRTFIVALVEAATAGQPFPEAARAAVMRVFPKLRMPLAIDHKARELLRREDVGETTVVLLARAGLELPDVVKAHVELVRGATSTRVLSTGEVVTTREAPNLEAINLTLRLLHPELMDDSRRRR